MPNYATTMWHNFEAIPDWFRMLFAAVYGVIWGLPVAKDYIGAMFSAAGTALNDRREYKLEKARINRQAVFNTLKQSGILPKVISQQQVDLVDKALDAGEQ